MAPKFVMESLEEASKKSLVLGRLLARPDDVEILVSSRETAATAVSREAESADASKVRANEIDPDLGARAHIACQGK